MRRGLVIGKFMPPHRGHLALIEFASKQCAELIVSMSTQKDDSINPVLRFQWLAELCKEYPNVVPEQVVDDFDDDSLPLNERTKIWAEFIKRRFPSVDAVFSSEEYGAPLARHLGIQHIAFDPNRLKQPVSATLIRSEPFSYWEFIPKVVRPYFVKKVCFYGPESTGKSSLTEKMARSYNTEFVPEVARELITDNNFTIEQIIEIGKQQTQRVLEKTKTANKILFCDTDLITTQIYSQLYLGVVPPGLIEFERLVNYDLYFLLAVDVPWIADGLRDLGHRRNDMYEIFKSALERRNLHFVPISGNWQERQSRVEKHIQNVLHLNPV